MLLKEIKRFGHYVLLAIVTIGFGAGMGLLGDGLNHTMLLAGWWGVDDADFSLRVWWSGFAAVLVFTLILGYLLYRYLPAQLPVRSLSNPQPPEPHKVLILILSVAGPGFKDIEQKQEDKDKAFEIITDEADATKKLLKTPTASYPIKGSPQEFRDTLEEAACRWNWSQLLSSIDPHIKSLKEIYILTSLTLYEDVEKKIIASKGSDLYASHFRELVQIFQPDIKIHFKAGINFDDFDAVYKLTNDFITQCKKDDKDNKENEIIIDVTGGTKITSIAASIVTLHNNTKFQYTNNNGIPLAYEVVYEPKSAIG